METKEEYEKRQIFEREVDADIVADFFRWRDARNVRRIWEHLGYERWAIGFARYLFPDFPKVLRRVIWAQLVYEERYRNQPASPRPVGKQRQHARLWSTGVIADFAKLEGLWAVCAPPIWDSIRTLGQIYRESATQVGSLNVEEKAKYARETRRRIEHEMEAFGRALVTVRGSPSGKTKGKRTAGRPRKPDASLTISGILKRSYRDGLRKRTK
jgi:hypothetical protein